MAGDAGKRRTRYSLNSSTGTAGGIGVSSRKPRPVYVRMKLRRAASNASRKAKRSSWRTSRSPRRAGPAATTSNDGAGSDRGNVPSFRPTMQTTCAGKMQPAARRATVTPSASCAGRCTASRACARSTSRASANGIGDVPACASRWNSRMRSRTASVSSAIARWAPSLAPPCAPRRGEGPAEPSRKKRSISLRSAPAHAFGLRAPASRVRSPKTSSQYVRNRPNASSSAVPLPNPAASAGQGTNPSMIASVSDTA